MSEIDKLFDEDIESLSWFDPLTGEVLRKPPRATIYPKTHYVTPRETLVAAVEAIRSELRDRLRILKDSNKLVEAQRLGEPVAWVSSREATFCSST